MRFQRETHRVDFGLTTTKCLEIVQIYFRLVLVHGLDIGQRFTQIIDRWIIFSWHRPCSVKHCPMFKTRLILNKSAFNERRRLRGIKGGIPNIQLISSLRVSLCGIGYNITQRSVLLCCRFQTSASSVRTHLQGGTPSNRGGKVYR